jgi:glycosyltransferase involved in cell wall biosynthesis
MRRSNPHLRLAIVQSHPTQYFSPWFRHVAKESGFQVKVFYLWEFGVKEMTDIDFKTAFVWDIPLLDGYESEFLPNRSSDPGTHHFRGLDNPTAVDAISAWNPDAVLIFGYGYATHLRLILSPELAHVPFLFRGDSHELYPKTSWRFHLGGLVRRLLFRRFQAFLAVGKANTQYFRVVGVPESKIVRAPHCVDNVRFQNAASQAEKEALEWKKEIGIPEGAPVILFAGKFEDKKCPVNLLKTFLAMPPRPGSSPQPVIFFVGGGTLEKQLRKTAGLMIGKTVFFAPFQNQSVMPKVYASGDLLVLPSYGRGETWGLAINEAMNMARPSIVSSHCGCSRDLILQGETGWVFPAGDWVTLGSLLAEAMSDLDKLKIMGLRAREYVAEFSFDIATSGLFQAMQNLKWKPTSK